MKYVYETENRSFEHYASGRVLYNAPGATAFPVRLASEIAQRCFRYLEEKGIEGPYSVYDPCCGGAYLLTSIALLHGQRIRKLFASDVNSEMLETAENNLSLLTKAGLQTRENQIRQLYERYQKDSHAEALKSVRTFYDQIRGFHFDQIHCFKHDITSGVPLAGQLPQIHMVITDLPYGELTDWSSKAANPLETFFEHLYPILNHPSSIIAVIADKKQKLKHDQYKKVGFFKIGKRQVGLFEPL